jgi:hypothetical protein
VLGPGDLDHRGMERAWAEWKRLSVLHLTKWPDLSRAVSPGPLGEVIADPEGSSWSPPASASSTIQVSAVPKYLWLETKRVQNAVRARQITPS